MKKMILITALLFSAHSYADEIATNMFRQHLTEKSMRFESNGLFAYVVCEGKDQVDALRELIVGGFAVQMVKGIDLEKKILLLETQNGHEFNIKLPSNCALAQLKHQ